MTRCWWCKYPISSNNSLPMVMLLLDMAMVSLPKANLVIFILIPLEILLGIVELYKALARAKKYFLKPNYAILYRFFDPHYLSLIGVLNLPTFYSKKTLEIGRASCRERVKISEVA